MKKIGKWSCPTCGSELEPDEEYMYSQLGDNYTKASKYDYPYYCSDCDQVWMWDKIKKQWVEG